MTDEQKKQMILTGWPISDENGGTIDVDAGDGLTIRFTDVDAALAKLSPNTYAPNFINGLMANIYMERAELIEGRTGIVIIKANLGEPK